MTTASDNPERPVLLTQLLTLFPGALRALDSVVPRRVGQESSVARRCARDAPAGHRGKRSLFQCLVKGHPRPSARLP